MEDLKAHLLTTQPPQLFMEQQIQFSLQIIANCTKIRPLNFKIQKYFKN